MTVPADVLDAVGIKALSAEELSRLVEVELGQPAYRFGQLLAWLYARGATSFDEMTDLPASLRESLGQRFALPTLALEERQESADGTRKYLWSLADGTHVESVGLPSGRRLTVCFSTQAGCTMGCAFCATGQGGYQRDLLPGEIVDQAVRVGRDFGVRVTNAVAMGQGEPFANYDSTLAALRILNAARGLGIGARHITVSTCGLIPGILRFAEEPEQFTLAVSLHSAIQETRDVLMPGVRGMPLPRLREALRLYGEKTGRRPSLEYALIDGVNDTDEQLDALAAFCRGLLCHVNLIPANPVEELEVARSPAVTAKRFERRLQDDGIEASLRAERGTDIDAACGQLRQRRSREGLRENPGA